MLVPLGRRRYYLDTNDLKKVITTIIIEVIILQRRRCTGVIMSIVGVRGSGKRRIILDIRIDRSGGNTIGQ